tara:strand:- start:89960 stop:91036 length:1077 start_codon:yes stop_codon:yes gene_type:complete
MSEQITFALPSDFPLDDVVEIGNVLLKTNALVPVFTPASAGLLSVEALLSARLVDKIDIQILPDRNLASRIAQIARNGIRDDAPCPMKVAAHIMAFAQVMDLLFEPTISFHELAHFHGNQVANEELAWFRIADNAGALKWIDLALGRRATLDTGVLPDVGNAVMDYQLRHWVRNYIVALKMAELEFEQSQPVEKMLRLLAWMFEDFSFRGPAAMFAAIFFSTKSGRPKLIRHLRSSDRSKTIKALKNATWDMTYLSDMLERTQKNESAGKRYIFATADKDLAMIAPLLVLYDDVDTLAYKLREWWAQSDANRIAEAIFDIRDKIDAVPHPRQKEVPPTFLDDCISRGEQIVLSWNPNS